jgi:hypothetical protein
MAIKSQMTASANETTGDDVAGTSASDTTQHSLRDPRTKSFDTTLLAPQVSPPMSNW